MSCSATSACTSVVEIVAPRVFAGAGSVLSPILDQLAAWFDKMEAAQRPEQRTAPRLLPVSDKPRQLLSTSGQLEDLFDMEEGAARQLRRA